MEDRKKLLEQFSRQLAEGNPLAEDFVNMKRSPMSQSIQARDLAEDALAHQVLKNTGVPIPAPSASRLKQEDFLNRIMKERYPELEPDVRLSSLGDNLGQYGEGIIDVNRDLRKDPIKSVSTALHEAGHQYDDRILKFDGTDDIAKKQLIKNVPEGRILRDLDPMQMSEIINKGHHARIPNLRDADSYGLGALKSMMKSGTFKQAAGALPLVGGLAAAAMTGDAMAAVPILGEADDIGEADRDLHEARKYQVSPAGQDATARRNALMKVKAGE